MIIRQLDSLVGQGCMRNATSVQGKGKQRAEEADSDSAATASLKVNSNNELESLNQEKSVINKHIKSGMS